MTRPVARAGSAAPLRAANAVSDARGRFVIAGGGTGGHVTPALALGEVLAALGEPVLFLGTRGGFETRLVPEAGFELVTLPSRQAAGASALGRLAAVASLIPTTFGALRILRAARARIVISVGGYAALPAAFAGVLMRIPLAVVEPNARPGRANRVTARFAARIFVGFESCRSAFGAARSSRVRCTGIPVRRALREAFSQAAPKREPTAPFRVLVFGGSQGARQLNEAMMAAAATLASAKLEVFHQSGPADRDRVAQAYERAGVRAEVVAFETDMPRRYRWADVALCRAGALSIAELTLAGLPAVLVPLPHAADDHQRENARRQVEAGAALMLEPTRLDPNELAETILELAAHPDRLAAMRRSAVERARPRAAEAIVEECRALLAARDAA